MHETHAKARSIFNPELSSKKKKFYDDKRQLRFVQYTSADAAMSIIQKSEIWLRNVRCMNDYREVEHGIYCLDRAFNDEIVGAKFRSTLEAVFPTIIQEFEVLFYSWIPYLKSGTYIACVSEHPIEENTYGRLSMWRAYGGKQSVALVFNKEPFFAETDVFHAYARPVLYLDEEKFKAEFELLALRIENEKDFIRSLGKECVKGYLFDIFKTYALCVKHPGFWEEKEWRVFYTPDMNSSDYIKSSIESVNGVPQEIFKIPLDNMPEHNFNGAKIAEVIERIIIGPTEHQLVLMDTFQKLLKKAGCNNAFEKVHCSGIPLR